jgi:S-adenosylmethionine:tRNA ribosyltransferase-isomerase
MSYFFDYHLPEHLIAQQPAARRDESRLLVVRRTAGELEHRTFRDLPGLLSPGDLLALNDTKVLPARVVGRRETTGGKWEGLFLRETDGGPWEMLAQTRGYPAVGEAFIVETAPVADAPGSPALRLVLRGRTEDRHWLMEPDPPGPPGDLLARFGQIPLPPYIRKGRAANEDAERYQTVFAEKVGSVAAPTAGLHFTPELLDRLKGKGVDSTRVTLHVGLGTFATVTVNDPTKHQIHAEWCEVTQPAVDAIAACKAHGGRVVAVGTTATRTLETAGLAPFHGETRLFIHPPYQFQVVDALVTNFHLPGTTLLLLVGAFAGSDLLRRAYHEAIRHGYRFYSYGDAMLVL